VTPACSGPSCNQGRQKCSTPDACQLADEGEPLSPADDALMMTLIVFAFALLAYLLWLLWTTLQ
jgi:multisubunit Na+/H+ antiporter MnhC subunit